VNYETENLNLASQSGNSYSEKTLGANQITGDNFMAGDPLARPNRRSGKGDRDSKDKYNVGTDPTIPRGEYKSIFLIAKILGSSRRLNNPNEGAHSEFGAGEVIENVGNIEITYDSSHKGYANNRDSRSSRNKINNDYQQIQQNRGYHQGSGNLGSNNNSNSNSSKDGKEDRY
jgi:hypothetical protein